MKKWFLLFILSAYSVLGQTENWINTIDAREHLVKSFFIKVQAKTTSLAAKDKGKMKIEKWSLFFSLPGFYHVDYWDDGLEHIYISDYNFLYEYLPLYKQALQTDLSRLSTKKKNIKLAKALNQVQLPFLFVGETLKRLKKEKIDNSSKKFYIVSGYFRYNKKKSFCKIWVDKQKLRPVKLELRQKGILVLSIQYKDYSQFKIVPKRIVYFINSENRNVKYEANIEDYQVNPKIDKKRFIFKPEKNVKIFKQKL